MFSRNSNTIAMSFYENIYNTHLKHPVQLLSVGHLTTSPMQMRARNNNSPFFHVHFLSYFSFMHLLFFVFIITHSHFYILICYISIESDDCVDHFQQQPLDWMHYIACDYFCNKKWAKSVLDAFIVKWKIISCTKQFEIICWMLLIILIAMACQFSPFHFCNINKPKNTERFFSIERVHI